MMACTLTLDSLGSVMAVSITESLWLGPSSVGGEGRVLYETNINSIKSFLKIKKIHKNHIYGFFM